MPAKGKIIKIDSKIFLKNKKNTKMFVTITNYSDHKVIFVRTKTGSFKFDLRSKQLTPAKPTVGFHINICEEPEDLTGFLSRVFSSKVGEVFNANHGLKTLPKVSPRY